MEWHFVGNPHLDSLSYVEAYARVTQHFFLLLLKRRSIYIKVSDAILQNSPNPGNGTSPSERGYY